MKKIKHALAMLMAALMLVGLAACAAPAADAPAADAPAAGAPAAEAPATSENVEINFLGAQYSDKTEAYIQSVIDKFEAEYPNVKVNLEIVGWDTIGTRISSMVGSKQAPDLYNGGSAAEYVADDLVYEVEDVISPELRADFFETFWNNNLDPDLGIAYQMPYLASVRALYYNKKIFNEVGIAAAPKTWAEVEAVCAQIKEFYNGDVYAWGLDGTMTEGQTTIAYYGWNNGGGFVDDAGNYIINSDANVEALEWVYNLYKQGYTNANPSLETRDDMQKLVAADKMAMLITANFFPALYPDVELGIAPIPYNDKNVSESSTMAVQDAVLFFNENAKSTKDTPAKMQAIRDFMDFFYKAENYVPFMIQEGLLPATNSGAALLVQENPEQAAYLDALNGAKFYARSKQNWKDCSTGICEADQKIFTGLQTPREALDELQALLVG